MTNYMRPVVFAIICSIATPVFAQDIVVNIEPAKVAPQTVMVEIDAVPKDLVRSPPNGFGYQTKLVLPASAWASNYLLVAQWPNLSQSIDLRITRKTPAEIKIWIYNREPSAEKSTLDDIDKGRRGLPAVLERYFVARDVYGKIETPDNEIKIRALKIWYDAAFSLAKDYSYVARDEQVVRLADEIEAMRKTNKGVAAIIKALAGSPDYFGLMNEQFKRFYFSEIALVPQYIQNGDIATAQTINAHFLQVLKGLSEDDRKRVLVIQGVSVELLEKNEVFLSTLGTVDKSKEQKN